MATVEELNKRYADLEKEARATSLAIGQHETRIETALENLAEVFPDQDVSDPRTIPFDELIEQTKTDIAKLSGELEEAFTVLEGRVEEANAELQRIVSA